MNELEIQEIENRIVSKQMKQLTGVPRKIRRQLSRMKEDVIKIWDIDTVYSADIQFKMFRTVANSCLTLDVLDVLIRKQSNPKMKFDKFLKRAVIGAKVHRKNELKNNKVDLSKRLKAIINGKVERFNTAT